MSNVISGMVQGNIAFKHFHFLTLGIRFTMDFLLEVLNTVSLAIIDGV